MQIQLKIRKFSEFVSYAENTFTDFATNFWHQSRNRRLSLPTKTSFYQAFAFSVLQKRGPF